MPGYLHSAGFHGNKQAASLNLQFLEILQKQPEFTLLSRRRLLSHYYVTLPPPPATVWTWTSDYFTQSRATDLLRATTRATFCDKNNNVDYQRTTMSTTPPPPTRRNAARPAQWVMKTYLPLQQPLHPQTALHLRGLTLQPSFASWHVSVWAKALNAQH